MTQPCNWQRMLDWSAELLLRRTGAGVDEWNRRIRADGPADEPSLRAWLSERGVTGYAQSLLVMERFGYPDFLLASADELIDGQYADRPALRPILDRLLADAALLGPVEVQARKGCVALASPRRQFAVVRASARDRVDLGLRLPGHAPGGRLRAATAVGNDAITIRVGLCDPDEVDEEVLDLLARAYAVNS